MNRPLGAWVLRLDELCVVCGARLVNASIAHGNAPVPTTDREDVDQGRTSSTLAVTGAV
jgi:hypothetical protein